MMQPTYCSTCQQPLPGGAAFCAHCGASQPPASAPHPGSQPSSGPHAATVRAGAPPSGIEYAPTLLQPPPAPPSGYPSVPHGSSGGYPPAPGPQGPLMPPGYAPGPPPVVTPGGGVAPWAQPPRKRSGMKVALGLLLVLILVLAVLAGGGFLLVKALSSRGNTAHQGSGAGTASGTPGPSPTPTVVAQTLDNINRQAIYGGATFTIVSAKEAASLPDLQQADPTLNVLEVQAKESNQINHGVYPQFNALGADGALYPLYSSSPSSLGAFWNADTETSGALFFKVPSGSKIGDFVLRIGNAQELPVPIPLTGAYDPNQWQPVTYPINKSVTINIGRVKLTVTQIVVVTWNPGFQAPRNMRLFRMYLHVENDAALAVDIGGGNYELVFPNGDTARITSIYGSLIDVGVPGGASQDVGYDTFLVPPAPAHYTMTFFNSDGSPAGQIDLGTV